MFHVLKMVKTQQGKRGRGDDLGWEAAIRSFGCEPPSLEIETTAWRLATHNRGWNLSNEAQFDALRCRGEQHAVGPRTAGARGGRQIPRRELTLKRPPKPQAKIRAPKTQDGDADRSSGAKINQDKIARKDGGREPNSG